MLFKKFNPEKYRNDFVILNTELSGKPVIYLDNACMTLRPKQVTDKIMEYYNKYPGCHGRSAHKIAARVTDEVDKARQKIQKFLGAKSKDEIIFTKNATEAINLLANGLDLKKGDVVINSDREHSSNIVPWQHLEKTKEIKRDFVLSKEDDTFDMDSYKSMLERYEGKVKIVSVVHTSNLDGYTLPVAEIIKLTHKHGALVMLDSAQAAPHHEINVQKLDADFVAISAHKMCGPSGVGALYGKKQLLEKLSPFILGGSTVSDTTYDDYKLDKIPNRFEAGLQNYAGIVGFGVACDYLKKIGLKKIEKYEQELTLYLHKKFEDIPKIKIVGCLDSTKRGGITSFVIDGVNYHDTALLLDEVANVMCRSGQHCLHSWFNYHHILGSVRISFYFYNTKKEIDTLVDALHKIIEMIK
jgi:cysteine desulfurase / selenocysteine lyase